MEKKLIFLVFTALLSCGLAAGAAAEEKLDASLPKVHSLRDIHHYIRMGSSLTGSYNYQVPEESDFNHSNYLHTLFFQYEFSPFKYVGFEFHGDFSGYYTDSTIDSDDGLTNVWGLFGPKFGLGAVFHPIKNKVVDPYVGAGLEFGMFYQDFYKGRGSSGVGIQTTVGSNFFIGRFFFLGTDVNYSYMSYESLTYEDSYGYTHHYDPFNVSDIQWRIHLGMAF